MATQFGMGEDTFVAWYQTDMGAEDFPNLGSIDPSNTERIF
jgi:hypothetical protein